MEKLFNFWLKGIAFSLANEKINIFKPQNLEVDFNSIYSIVQNNHDFYYSLLNQIIERENELVEFIEKTRINGLNNINSQFKRLKYTFLDYSRDLVLWNVIYGNYLYFHLTSNDLDELNRIIEYGKGNKRLKRSQQNFLITENLSLFLVFYLLNNTHEISRNFQFLFAESKQIQSNLHLDSENLRLYEQKLKFIQYSLILLGILFPYSRISELSFSILNKNVMTIKKLKPAYLHTKKHYFPFIDSYKTSSLPVNILFSCLSSIHQSNKVSKDYSSYYLNSIFERFRFNNSENILEKAIIKIFYSSLFDQYEKYHNVLFYDIVFILMNSDNFIRKKIHKNKILSETDYLKNTFEYMSFLLGMSVWPPIPDLYINKFSKELEIWDKDDNNYIRNFYKYIILIKLRKPNKYFIIEEKVKEKIDFNLKIRFTNNRNRNILIKSDHLNYNGFSIFYFSIFSVLDYSSIYNFVREKIFSIINQITTEKFDENIISDLFGLFKGLQFKVNSLKKNNWDFLTELMKILINNYRYYLSDWTEEIINQLDQTLNQMNDLVKDKSYYKTFQQILYA